VVEGRSLGFLLLGLALGRGIGRALEDALELLGHRFIGYAEAFEDLRGQSLFLLDQGEEEVFCADDVGFVMVRLHIGVLEDFFGALGEGDVADGHGVAGDPSGLFEGGADLFEVAAEGMQDFDGDALAFTDQPKQQVLRADIVMSKSECFISCKLDDHLYAT